MSIMTMITLTRLLENMFQYIKYPHTRTILLPPNTFKSSKSNNKGDQSQKYIYLMARQSQF